MLLTTREEQDTCCALRKQLRPSVRQSVGRSARPMELLAESQSFLENIDLTVLIIISEKSSGTFCRMDAARLRAEVPTTLMDLVTQ